MISENSTALPSAHASSELPDRSDVSDEENGENMKQNELSMDVSDDDSEKKKLRNSLLYAVEEGAVGDLVKLFFYDQNKAKLLEVVRGRKYFNRGYARRFFAAAGEILATLISEECYVPASAFVSDDENEYDKLTRSPEKVPPESIVPDEDSTEALSFMRACSMIVGSYLDGLVEANQPPNKQTNISEEVLTVAELLHDVLIYLQSCGPEGIITQASVCAMCQKWWHGNFQNKELLVTQLVPTLLVKSLDIKSKAVNVKNVYSIRRALTLFDFEDGSISYLKSLLLKTVLCPLYHKVPEGSKFISFLFQVHESLVIDLHKYIRAQIPRAKKSMLESYRDIYIKAWKESPEAIRKCIEEESLQDFMYSSLYFEKTSSVKAVRTILTPFHQGKNAPEVDELLHKMYTPILWRALKAANPSVRINASVILAETFPLRDPSGSNEHVQECLDRTMNALLSLLRDADPRVRVAGSDAAARILLDYWSALPSESIRLILNQIIAKHTSDTSSSAVRASAIYAVTLLLKCPHSHAVLRSLLPSLGNLLHDKSERVRLSVVHMLLEVKQTKGFKFYHIVPVELLLARLATEGEGGRPVASGLTGLLLDSYFPQGQHITGAIQVQRTLSLLSSNPKAAQVFYQNLNTHISVNSIVKLMIMLLKCLRASVRADKSIENQQPHTQTTDENTSLISLTASNTAVMKSIAQVIWYLWDSISDQLTNPGNEACQECLFEAFSSAAFTELYTHFENKVGTLHDNLSTNVVNNGNECDCFRICSALLRCAAMIPEQSLQGLSKHLKSVISNSRKQIRPMDISLPMSLLCLWGHKEDVLLSLASSISSGLGKMSHTVGFREVSQVSDKIKKRSKSKGREDVEVAFDLSAESAIRILGKILSGSDTIYVASRKLVLQSEGPLKAIEEALKKQIFSIEEALKPAIYKWESYEIFVPLLALETYMRLSLHKAGRDEGNMQLDSNLLSLMQWITSRVVPTTLNVHPLGDLNVSKISAAASPTSPETSELQSWEPALSKARISERLSSPFLHSFTHDYDQVSAYSHAVAVVVIKTMCIMMSEWFAAGGSASEDIVQELSKWAPALRQQTCDLNTGRELIPVYTRLALHTVKAASNCTLLKELLVHSANVDSGSIEEKLIEESVTFLLSLKESAREASISAILEGAVSTACISSTNTNNSSFNDEEASKSATTNSSAVRIALSQVTRNGPGSVILARLISKNLSHSNVNDVACKEIQENILKNLLDEAPATGKYGAEVREICRMILQ